MIERSLDAAPAIALEQFAQTSQLNALKTIIKAGQTLEDAIQKHFLTPKDYNTTSIESVLEHILNNIQEVQEFTGHLGAVCTVTFAPDGNCLASGSEDGTIRLWNKQGTQLKCFNDPRNWVWGCDFGHNGRYLVSACDDGTARLWDLNSQDNSPVTIEYGAPIRDVAFSPDGEVVAIACTDGKVFLCNLEGKKAHQ